MFANSLVLNQELGNWLTSQVTTMDSMFSNTLASNPPLVS